MIRRILSTLVLSTAIVAGACYEDDAMTSPARGVQAQIVLTDAPFPYDSVARVDIYIVSIAASTGIDTTDQPGGPEWVTIAEPKQRFNLLDLQHGVTDTIGSSLIPAANYRSLRMIIDTDSSSITSKSGYELPVNWGFSAGRPKLYSLVEGYAAESGDSASIVIDFDVGRSFSLLPSGYGFQFYPVMRSVNAEATGTVAGVVRGDTLTADPKPIGDVTITVFSGNPGAPQETWSVRATSRTLSDGHFRVDYLMPGTYIVRSDAPRGSPFSAGTVSGVVVTKGMTTTRNITLPKRSATDITIVPASRTMIAGQYDSLSVFATDSTGQPLVGAAFTWSVNLDSVLTVTPNPANTSKAVVHALRNGYATVTACYSGSCAAAYITVQAAPPPANAVKTVTVTPSSLNMHVGDSVAIAATLKDSLGNTLSNRAVTWRAVDSTVVRIFGYGTGAVLRALKPGSVIVVASSEGKEGASQVVVLSSSPSLAVRRD